MVRSRQGIISRVAATAIAGVYRLLKKRAHDWNGAAATASRLTELDFPHLRANARSYMLSRLRRYYITAKRCQHVAVSVSSWYAVGKE